MSTGALTVRPSDFTMTRRSDTDQNRAYWEHFEHDADIGVRGVGDSLEAAFEQAALALTAVVCEPSEIAQAEAIDVRCRASNREALFVEWLNILVLEMAARSMLFAKFKVTIRGDQLAATLFGEAVDRDRHQPVVEVKGATYTALKVQQDNQGRWLAQCIVDV